MVEWVNLAGYFSEWMGAVAIAWVLLASPRFQRPALGFRFPRREGIMALSVFALITVAAWLIYRAEPPEFPWGAALPAPALSFTRAAWIAGLTLIPVVVALVARGQPARSAGWDRARLRIGVQMGLALALLTIFLRNQVFNVLGALSLNGNPNESLAFASDSLSPALAFLLALGIAIAEETTFRGYIQPRLSAWLGEWAGLALSAFLFTLWHAVSWLVGSDPQGLSLQASVVLLPLGLTLAQGLVLGVVMRSTGHVLAPALYRAVSIWLRIF